MGRRSFHAEPFRRESLYRRILGHALDPGDLHAGAPITVTNSWSRRGGLPDVLLLALDQLPLSSPVLVRALRRRLDFVEYRASLRLRAALRRDRRRHHHRARATTLQFNQANVRSRADLVAVARAGD